MAFLNPDCLGHYDFEHIADYAYKKFVKGYSTIELLQSANTLKEKEEIALVASMDLDDETVTNLNLSCEHADNCKVTSCRQVIKKLIESQLRK